MNRKEINELKRRFRADKTNIGHVYGCYVNTQGEIVSHLDTSLGMVPEEETEMYLDRLKKVLGGTPGKNLIDIVFSNEQVSDSDEHRLLMAMRDSKLDDPEVRQEFYEKAVSCLNMEGENYLILLAFDSYDVPRKAKDGTARTDESEQVFAYVVCAICPVKDGGAELKYFHEEGAFHLSGTGQVAAKTELGFLFPAFDGRRTNIYNALYYTKKPEEMHPEFIDGIFRTDVPMSAQEQRETFNGLLSDTLEEDFSYSVMQAVHEQLRERIMEHRTQKDPEPLELSTRELSQVLVNSGVAEQRAEAFREACKEPFGEHAALNPENLIESGKFELVIPEVKITVNPEYSYMVESRVIGGRKYLLIPADQGVELNGVALKVNGMQEESEGQGEGEYSQADDPPEE